ncbi:MAG: hypothetical protein ACWM0S_06540 [Schaalia turicensis]
MENLKFDPAVTGAELAPLAILDLLRGGAVRCAVVLHNDALLLEEHIGLSERTPVRGEKLLVEPRFRESRHGDKEP